MQNHYELDPKWNLLYNFQVIVLFRSDQAQKMKNDESFQCL